MLSIPELGAAIGEHAAVRRIRRMQPAGGIGDKLFPPTYPAEREGPPRHVFERRRLDDREVWCVLIDSVQSQANRMEEALLAAAAEQAIPLPYVTVDFREAGLQPLEQITSLDAPHRVYDAIIRDSLLDDVPFMESEQGRRLAAATPAAATALLEISPSALLFGAWHSQGEGGGLGAKFPRALVSEIMGVDTPVEELVRDRRTGRTEPQTAGRRTGSRMDPLGILRKVEVYKSPTAWSTDKEAAGRGAKKVRPSEINHGNIAPTVEPLGVTCAYAEHRAVLTLAGLRRLRFGGGERDAAGRALLAALGLVALTEQDARGYALRSRCDLVCDGAAGLELVHADGSKEPVEVSCLEARDLYCEAYETAEQAGIAFSSITLKPQPKLVEIVRRSRELALEGEGRDGQGRVSLVLEIEFLTGVYRAAHSPASNTPDWPPQPDRVFSGLVAAWAARGEQSIERLALEWLEARSAPAIDAGDHTVRTAPDVFVPPNDQRETKTEQVYLKVMPGWRPRQPRRFPVARLDDPVMAMVWAADPEPKVLAALDALARDVGYIGHSASLVRCRFLAPSSPAPQHVAVPAARQVYPGRFAELRRAYRLKPARPVILPGAVVLPQPAAPAPAQADWLVLEAIGGSVPDIRAAALVAGTLRRRLMGGYRSIGMADEIPAAVSGHTPDGSPTRASHLAIAPLAFAGYPHADGRVFGFALIPSAPMVLGDVPGLGAAFEKVAPYDSGAERRVLELRCVPHQPLQLAPAGESSKRSLMPGPYLQPARVWASVTPVVLDRHLKGYDEGKIRELIADSCANVGLPRPDPDRIQVGKHAAIAGVPPAWPRPGAPPWTRWQVPQALRSRLLTHVAIDFGCEVAGPVMLGAGRYMGLGLCRRLVGTAG